LKIDIFSHILPEKYLSKLLQKVPQLTSSREVRNRAAINLDVRLKVMERYPDVLQVLTVSLPPLSEVVSVAEASELARTANDELAEILVKYPDKFAGAVACLPLGDMDEALKETDRAITQLGFKGVQVFAKIQEDSLDQPVFRPLYEKMVKYDLPIWIHPTSEVDLDESIFGWPFATSSAMRRIVSAGIFNDYPELKFITHHCGGNTPYHEGRIKWLMPLRLGKGHVVKNPVEHFKKFYNDTATYGNTAVLMCGYDFFGADHLLYGTDSPLGPEFGLTLETTKSVERMNIPEDEKEKIFSGNAVKLLKIAT